MGTIKEFIDGYFTSAIKVTKRTFVILFLFYFSESTVYYFYTTLLLSITADNASQANLMSFFLDLLIAFSMVLSVFLFKRIRKTTIMYFSATMLIITTFFLIGLQGFYPQLLLICAQGVFLGMLAIAFNVYFCNQIEIEARGRVGGTMIFLSSLLGILLSSSLLKLENPPLIVIFLGICTLMVRPLKPDEGSPASPSKSTYVDRKNFFLYYIPWIIFCLINSTLQVVNQRELLQSLSIDFLNRVYSLNFLGAGLGSIIGGFMSDRIGRKPVLMYGLTSLGISYTLAGLSTNTENLILLYFLNGFSWGIFLVLYYLFLWGEFQESKSWNFYYSLGLSTFHWAKALGFLIVPFLSEINISMAALLSAMMIFISNIPLIYAKETLPPQYKFEVGNLNKYISKIKNELRKIAGEKK